MRGENAKPVNQTWHLNSALLKFQGQTNLSTSSEFILLSFMEKMSHWESSSQILPTLGRNHTISVINWSLLVKPERKMIESHQMKNILASIYSFRHSQVVVHFQPSHKSNYHIFLPEPISNSKLKSQNLVLRISLLSPQKIWIIGKNLENIILLLMLDTTLWKF